MHPQLSEIIAEFDSASARLRRLVDDTPADRWNVRHDPERWSVAECVAHLNLTSKVYLPLLDDMLADARRLRDRGLPAPARYRRDALGWLLWRTIGPTTRMRVKTGAAFVPGGELAREDVVSEFEALQQQLVDRVRQADGLPVHAVRVRSPFGPVRYNGFATLTILPRHQHRHLFQAERVWHEPVPPRGTGVSVRTTAGA